MKKSIIIAFLLCLSVTVNSQRVMKVEKTDGTVIEYPVSDVKRVFFEIGGAGERDEAVDAGLCPNSNHPHIIDLGIGVKWSCCNVGSDKPYNFGNYYAWGETTEKGFYSPQTYIFSTRYSEYMPSAEKYEEFWYTANNIGEDISNTVYDVAHLRWHTPWRMPTAEEFEALAKCSISWISINNNYGYKFTGQNGNSIFLPACGYCENGEIKSIDCGEYWSSSHGPLWEWTCRSMFFFRGYAGVQADLRWKGLSIRPVAD